MEKVQKNRYQFCSRYLIVKRKKSFRHGRITQLGVSMPPRMVLLRGHDAHIFVHKCIPIRDLGLAQW
jgi:hypothetical protein